MATPKKIKLSEYQPTPYTVESVHLTVAIFEEKAQVTSKLKMKQVREEPLVFAGQKQSILKISIDGNELSPDEYNATPDSLTIEKPGKDFEIEIITTHDPKINTSFMGLYMSQGNYFTQCEAEGFRRITYYYDRPDCMSIFTTRIEASKAQLPVLLSNGNKIESGDLDNGRHFATFHDPFPKPAYLFALVAADLPSILDTYTTGSGKKVALEIYARKEDIEKCHFAMGSLKRSMQWDEDFYGLECDLDAFKIVAVSDFNFGAMENKGLNIFNTSAVLASTATTIDAAFIRIESVVAHEYFHNWSGNRVTCQSWFQLCLKEGLTVFRDQEFTSTMHSRGVNRIETAKYLKEFQFAEDAGPLAHPVRPEEYMQIDNFYTLTIYEKGAEIVRMIHTILGPKDYRKGVDCYFSRHDGQAVTVEDFIKAMSDGSGTDLSKMMEWYKHPGTPHVKASSAYNAAQKTLTLTLEQENKKSPKAPPMVMPVVMGLIGQSGKALTLNTKGGLHTTATQTTLMFDQNKQSFTFNDITEESVFSIFRQLSAPVKLDCGYSKEDLLHLMKNDTDEFNRYQSAQELFMQSLLQMIASNSSEVEPELNNAFTTILKKSLEEPAVAALTLQIPSESQIAQELSQIDVEGIHAARKTMLQVFATENQDLLQQIYLSCQNTKPEDLSPAAVGKRSLMNLCLSYIAKLENEESWSLVRKQFDEAKCMTEELTPFSLLVKSDYSRREEVVDNFYNKWQNEDLVINNWFGIQCNSDRKGNLATVKKLLKHPVFSYTNPNRLRALVQNFVGNMTNFHAVDGSGYEFLGGIILEIDKINTQTAARLTSAFALWRKFPSTRQKMMKDQLERIMKSDGLSKGTYEMVSRTLAD